MLTLLWRLLHHGLTSGGQPLDGCQPNLENLRWTDPYFLIGTLGGAMWIVTYVLVIIEGRRSRTHAIPLVAICLNYAWEILASFHWGTTWGGIGELWLGMDRAWLLVDTIIVVQLLRYGSDNLPRARFLAIVGVSTAFGLWGQWAFTETYRDPMGFICAFIINLVMSALFVFRFMRGNDSLRGHSYPAAWTKMLGTAGTAILGSYVLPATHCKMTNFQFLYFLYLSIFMLDCTYIYLVWRARRASASASASAPDLAASSTSAT